MATSPIQGYIFASVDEDDPQNRHVCKILRRADVSDVELRDMGPAFVIQFGDGSTRTAYGDELHPWYPV